MATDFFWKVEESVGRGLYIVWPDSYSSRLQAERAIGDNPNARAKLYQTGKGDGPVRADTGQED